MKRRFYLGLNMGGPKVSECLWTHGTSKDLRELSEYLAERYSGASVLTKNGRSALCFALKSYFNPGDKIIINAFTCYAVYEAVVKAGMTPIFADINRKDLNFDEKTLEKIVSNKTKGIILQNSLGNPVDIKKIEKFASEHGLLIIEDLAHSAGARYYDDREMGTIGVATVLSFGKDKSINTVSGGAAVLRSPVKHRIEAPFKSPRLPDHLRARFYPLLCAVCRGLNYIHLGGIVMRFLQWIHFVEKSADSKLDMKRRLSKFQAKLALKQFKAFHHRGQGVLRNFYLVRDRAKVLAELKEANYYFDSFWYEKPVSPARYYNDIKFPEKDCPVAVEVTNEIINFPIYYKKTELAPAYKIIEPYLIEGKNE